jgi:hypothetical protein
MTRAMIVRRLAVVSVLAATPWIASAIVSCSAAAPACKGAHLANEACDLFMLARPNDAGVEPVSAPELSRFAEEHHKARAMRIVDAGAER